MWGLKYSFFSAYRFLVSNVCAASRSRTGPASFYNIKLHLQPARRLGYNNRKKYEQNDKNTYNRTYVCMYHHNRSKQATETVKSPPARQSREHTMNRLIAKRSPITHSVTRPPQEHEKHGGQSESPPNTPPDPTSGSTLNLPLYNTGGFGGDERPATRAADKSVKYKPTYNSTDTSFPKTACLRCQTSVPARLHSRSK